MGPKYILFGYMDPLGMELGPQNHNGDGLLGANSIIVVYMDPLGKTPHLGISLTRLSHEGTLKES